MKIKELAREEEDRQLLEVKVFRTINGTLNGERYLRSGKLIFVLGCDIEDGKFEQCLIHGITPFIVHEQNFTLHASPVFSRVFNRDLDVDTRLSIPWEISWNAGFTYHYYIKEKWGLGTGFNTGSYRHSLNLDRLDPVKGHDPNLEDVLWEGELNYIELPLLLLYNYGLGQKYSVGISGGVIAGYRIYENITSTARNAHSGQVHNGVVSDPYKYENITDFDIGLDIGLSVKYLITEMIGVKLEGGFRQGIQNVKKQINQDLPYSIYQGQFNPLFYGGGASSHNQMLYSKVGITIDLTRKNN
jgi:hypothetical protein